MQAAISDIKMYNYPSLQILISSSTACAKPIWSFDDFSIIVVPLRSVTTGLNIVLKPLD